MPKARGRHGRQHRRDIAKIRHQANIKTRAAERAIFRSAEVFAIFLAVLAQHGGETTITKGTLEQVGQNLAHLGYTVVPGKAENEFIVRMIESDIERKALDDVADPSMPPVVEEVQND